MTTLFEKLTAAGLPIASASESGEISGLPGITMTPEQDELFRDICREHFHPVEFAREQRSKARQQAAKAEAALATQFRTLTPQGAIDYIETNVTTLATAKTVLKIMARILIAMRDEMWADMAE